MKSLLFVLLALAAAVGISLLAHHDPGYLLITYSGWSVETSLAVALILLVTAFAVLYFLLRMAVGAWTLPQRLARWRRYRRAARNRRATTRGLIALTEGHWKRAEQILTRNAPESDTPLLNYLGAARAAQKQGEDERRDQYLSQAYRSTPEAELAVGLTQAEVQLSSGQLEQALATLMHLRGIAPRHTHVLYLLKRLYERLGSWNDLRELLPELRRHQVLTPAAADALEHQIHAELLEKARRSGQLESLRGAWTAVPKAMRHDPALAERYARGLIDAGRHTEAEPLLGEVIRKRWAPTLVALYGHVEGENASAQLREAERWLQEHEHDPDLLLTVGRLSIRNELWGKARAYLEASVGARPSAEGYRELGELLDRLGEKEAAERCFREGLRRALAAGA